MRYFFLFSFLFFIVTSFSFAQEVITDKEVQDLYEYSSVRIRAKDSLGVNYGSGTVVATKREGDKQKCLIATVFHIFRKADDRTSIDVDYINKDGGKTYEDLVEFQKGKKDDTDLARLEAKEGYIQTFRTGDTSILARDSEADVSLFEVECPLFMRPVPVAKSGTKVGDGVCKVGCPGGLYIDPRMATVTNGAFFSRVTALNRYLGPDSIEIEGQTKQGLSGGGLFRKENGQIVMVGNVIANDRQDKRTLCSGTKPLQDIISRISGKLTGYSFEGNQLAEKKLNDIKEMCKDSIISGSEVCKKLKKESVSQ